LIALLFLVPTATATLTQTPTIALGEESATQEPLPGLGTHWRLLTRRGVIHVFRPYGYQRETAGTLVYVHGYYTHVDRAFAEHRLAEQFAKSRQNAQFIVPEAPAARKEPVFFTDLRELLDTVARLTNRKIPDGPLIVLGHSGAYRTLAEWLAFKRVDEMILLDALYAHEADFAGWIGSLPGHQAKKLILVSIETADRTDAMVRAFPFAALHEEVPGQIHGFSKNDRAAQLLYVRSKLDHMALVTGGEVIPLVLRLTPLARLAPSRSLSGR
jgi:hypothetical protein